MADGDMLERRMLLDRMDRHVAADARQLETAEGHFRRSRAMIVDPHRPGFDQRGAFDGAIDVPRPDRRRQSVGDVIGLCDRVIFVRTSCNLVRARASRDITVPIGVSVTVAISR